MNNNNRSKNIVPCPQILSLLQSLGCGVTLVSGMELNVAKAAGFSADSMLLNGSGKTAWEVTEAVKEGVLLNVDSEFDLQQLLKVCQELGLKARVLLRLNLDIDPVSSFSIMRMNTCLSICKSLHLCLKYGFAYTTMNVHACVSQARKL